MMLFSVQMKVTWLLWQQMWCTLLEENVSGESTIRHTPSGLLKDRDQCRSKLVLCMHCDLCNRLLRSKEGWW